MFYKGLYIYLSLSGSSHLPYTLTQGEDGVEGSGEDDSGADLDPCFHYTVLDQAWRATNYSTKNVACDNRVQWKGWYRLFYRGKTIQMPERCVRKEMCGTHAPLWLVGGHPRLRDGVVTRKVCGNWRDNCCLFKSPPIQVKACRGNYYVYKFVKPVACHLAYCAGKMWCTQALITKIKKILCIYWLLHTILSDVNTLVCGKCKKSESCVSRDKITWLCKKNQMRGEPFLFINNHEIMLGSVVIIITIIYLLIQIMEHFPSLWSVVKANIHFFATYPANISGKVNKIVYRKVYVNQGGAFDSRSGIFRAPVSGVYQFFFSTQTGGSGETDLWLVVNNYWVAVSHSNVQGSNSVGNLSTYMTTLRKGATVYVTHNRGRSWANSASNTIAFGGSLLMVRKI